MADKSDKNQFRSYYPQRDGFHQTTAFRKPERNGPFRFNSVYLLAICKPIYECIPGSATKQKDMGRTFQLATFLNNTHIIYINCCVDTNHSKS